MDTGTRWSATLSELRQRLDFSQQVHDARATRQIDVIQAQVDELERQWAGIDKAHERNLSESRSQSWTDGLVAVYQQRCTWLGDEHSRLCGAIEEIKKGRARRELDWQTLLASLLEFDSVVLEFQSVLAVKRRQMVQIGEYGDLDDSKWLAEKVRFLTKNPRANALLSALRSETLSVGEPAFDWPTHLCNAIDDLVEPSQSLPNVAIGDGLGFELACAERLVALGWNCSLTKTTGDQGVDILARRGSQLIALQCKNTAERVGNAAVQEIHAGSAFYEASIGAVVARSGYTSSAIGLANKLGVLLLDVSELGEIADLANAVNTRPASS